MQAGRAGLHRRPGVRQQLGGGYERESATKGQGQDRHRRDVHADTPAGPDGAPRAAHVEEGQVPDTGGGIVKIELPKFQFWTPQFAAAVALPIIALAQAWEHWPFAVGGMIAGAYVVAVVTTHALACKNVLLEEYLRTTNDLLASHRKLTEDYRELMNLVVRYEAMNMNLIMWKQPK
jgi:hypothetical protein